MKFQPNALLPFQSEEPLTVRDMAAAYGVMLFAPLYKQHEIFQARPFMLLMMLTITGHMGT